MKKVFENVIKRRDMLVSQELRNNIVTSLIVLFCSMDILVGTQLFTIQYRWYYLFTALVIGVFIFVYARLSVFQRKIPKGIVIAWVIMWTWFLVNTVFVQTNFLPVPIISLFLFSALYFLFPKEEEKNFFDLVTKGVSVAFAMCIALSLLLNPFLGRGYTGIFTNTNYMGQFVTIIFAILLASIYKRESTKILLYTYLLLGFSITFTFFSLSRTAWVSCAIIFVVFVIASRYKSNKKSRKNLLKTVGKTVLSTLFAIAILLSSTALLFHEATGLSRIGMPQIEQDGLLPLEGKPSFTWDARAYSFSYRVLANVLPGHIVSPWYFGEPAEGEGDTDVGEALNNFSSGRLAKWQIYSENIGVFAKPESERPYDVDGKSTIRNAHNTFFELAFIGGIITAVLFVVFKLYMLIKAFLLTMKHRENNTYIYSLLIVVAVSMTGIFASVYSPGPQFIGFAMYLAVIPVFNAVFEKKANVDKVHEENTKPPLPKEPETLE